MGPESAGTPGPAREPETPSRRSGRTAGRDAAARQIDVQLLSGPFKHLVNRWRFVEAPGGTKIEFDIDFEFKSRLLSGVLAANFHHAVDKLMSCFEGRAKSLYPAV